MTDNEVAKALDILEKHEFFGGQRAGRELWSKKPVDVQNEDIEDFVKDFAYLKDFIVRIANGVIVPPCKVGDVLYFLADLVDELFIDEIRVTEVGTKHIFASACKDDEDDFQDVYFYSDIGESLFLTREEAERALAERIKRSYEASNGN